MSSTWIPFRDKMRPFLKPNMDRYFMTTPDWFKWFEKWDMYKRMKDEYTIETISSYEWHMRYPMISIIWFKE